MNILCKQNNIQRQRHLKHWRKKWLCHDAQDMFLYQKWFGQHNDDDQ